MAVTRSWERRSTPAIAIRRQVTNNPERTREFWWLLFASALLVLGLSVVFHAKTQEFPALTSKLDSGLITDLNQIGNAPLKLSEDAYINERLQSYLSEHRPLSNVGALAKVRLTATDALNDPRAASLWRTRTANQKPLPASISLIVLRNLKAQLVVRTPQEFRREFLFWVSLYLFAFWAVHFIWRAFAFQGDGSILPATFLLTGMGLMLMLSLRDPLRDTLEFKKFAWGCVGGCVLLLLPLLKIFDYRRLASAIYTPLWLALALFGALLAFGSGPTGSSAKVNLGPFQPVEIVKILVVFFMAGYFARNWEHLRDLQIKFLARGINVPRLQHALPVMFGVSIALALFFVLKDMGPALVMGFVFLILFAVARGRAGLAVTGIAFLLAGVAIGNHFGAPQTVVERVAMWLSPWDNDIRGGDQLAHSLWALATGGMLGSGPGWGDPSVIPAGHTDLVLASIGEEWGLAGIISIAVLFAFLLYRGWRIALTARDEYGLFLALGLSVLLGLEMLLISGGALGAIPLSGVVSPFLSSGNTAMLANFFIVALLAAISHQNAASAPVETTLEPIFAGSFRWAGVSLAVAATALLVRAAVVQVLEDRQLIARSALVYTADGVKRPEYNPRLSLLAAEIPRGDIFDRNGVLLATSRWDQLEKYRPQYAALGINIDEACPRKASRFYPFGGATAHLIGDLRTGENFHASNSSLIEHDSNQRLQGYRDYEELAPLVRYRHQTANRQLQALFQRDRNVRSTIDIRLQLKAIRILQRSLEPSGKKGAVVVMKAQSGEVLALVSFPTPPDGGTPLPDSKIATPDDLLDRARYGQYPPGSTFKLVTAMAALRIDPRAMTKKYKCEPLGDGRAGITIPGWRRPIRDDVEDHPHGTLDMATALTVSCNAYFAQLGVDAVGSRALRETAGLLGIPVGTPVQLKQSLPFASYGQGEVLMTPFKMARIAATIADQGQMPEGSWVSDASNQRLDQPHPILDAASAIFLQNAMRSVVTNGTARAAMQGLSIDIAGKTGTAQLDKGEPHSWFAGFAPCAVKNQTDRIAFAVLVEHGGYGAKFAAPIARQVVEAAQEVNIIRTEDANGQSQPH